MFDDVFEAKDGSGEIHVGQGCLGGFYAYQHGRKIYEDEEIACRHDGEGLRNPIPLTTRRVAALLRGGWWSEADAARWLKKQF